MLKKISIAILVGILVLLAVLFRPLPAMVPTPADRAPDEGSSEIDPRGQSVELNHGAATEDVFVLLHGVTNSPLQFLDFGKLLYDRGANVLIPRLPFHGYRDRMTPAHQFLTAQLMLDQANRAIDRAKKIGRKITVVGLSVNGNTAAWIAQNRADVDFAVVMAPFFAARGMPDWSISPAARLFSHLPNVFVWWDPKMKDQLDEGALTYPRFSTRSLASILGLGVEVFREAQEKPPLAKKILIMTSAADTAISNPRAEQLAEIWKKSAPGRVATYQFPLEWNVPHDWMDAQQPGQKVDIVYPILLDLLMGPTPAAN
ncbi:MAG: alpha/beta hydrolase [Terrimicrobiaceae bacterium]